MKTLLTGATGLVGANLAHLLCEQGERPRLLVRERSDRRGLRGLSYDEVLGDVLDADSLRGAMKGVDRVYHVAGIVRFDPFTREDVSRLNTQGTRNVLDAARAAGARRVVVVSSVAAVGHGTLAEPATEESTYNYAGDNPYHESKREAERLALEDSGLGLEVLAGNPSFVLGPYDVKPSTGELLLHVARGVVLAYPSGGINVVNAQDVARGLRLIMEKGRPRERYILGGGEPDVPGVPDPLCGGGGGDAAEGAAAGCRGADTGKTRRRGGPPVAGPFQAREHGVPPGAAVAGLPVLGEGDAGAGLSTETGAPGYPRGTEVVPGGGDAPQGPTAHPPRRGGLTSLPPTLPTPPHPTPPSPSGRGSG
ncbi:MAG TPA: NAD-dependent epimerase/dehydratase family protein [Archangium sp.]|nr:NAD-dependent epimerase/dehydratase family protein [Archangium sp.]